MSPEFPYLFSRGGKLILCVFVNATQSSCTVPPGSASSARFSLGPRSRARQHVAGFVSSRRARPGQSPHYHHPRIRRPRRRRPRPPRLRPRPGAGGPGGALQRHGRRALDGLARQRVAQRFVPLPMGRRVLRERGGVSRQPRNSAWLELFGKPGRHSSVVER